MVKTGLRIFFFFSRVRLTLPVMFENVSVQKSEMDPHKHAALFAISVTVQHPNSCQYFFVSPRCMADIQEVTWSQLFRDLKR